MKAAFRNAFGKPLDHCDGRSDGLIESKPPSSWGDNPHLSLGIIAQPEDLTVIEAA